MAKLWYEHSAVYVLPKGNTYWLAIDAIDIDSVLFDDNIPVKDCRLWVTAKPRDQHMIMHILRIGLPSYANGKVVRLGVRFDWWPFQNHEQSDVINYNNNPYGMGLNTIVAEMTLDTFPLTRDVVYDVAYIMEVDV